MLQSVPTALHRVRVLITGFLQEMTSGYSVQRFQGTHHVVNKSRVTWDTPWALIGGETRLVLSTKLHFTLHNLPTVRLRLRKKLDQTPYTNKTQNAGTSVSHQGQHDILTEMEMFFQVKLSPIQQTKTAQTQDSKNVSDKLKM